MKHYLNDHKDHLKQHDNKQIFHAFLFNIRNYSPEVINIQRRDQARKHDSHLQRYNN